MKRWIAAGLVTGIVAVMGLGFACESWAGQEETRTFVLYGGSNTDSTEQASVWIPVRGASRILVRLWSAHAAFTLTAADTAGDDPAISPITRAKDSDSTYSDSVTVFRVAFTDSASSTNPLVAGDSVIFTASFLDTNTVMAGAAHPPLNQALRGPANGSGIYSIVYPLAPSAAALNAFGEGSITKKYMRVYVTPLRRMTVSGGNSTAGKRVNGLKGLRGEALVVYRNK